MSTSSKYDTILESILELELELELNLSTFDRKGVHYYIL